LNEKNNLYMLKQLKKEILSHANPEKARLLQRFFKTGKGQYGEGDRFFGITVPIQRKIAKQYKTLPLKEIEILLQDPIHECRLIALFILTAQFSKAEAEKQKKIFDLYVKNTKFINNWDLVDLSAPYIIGPFRRYKNKSILIKFAHSKNLWERRISVLATFDYIKMSHFHTALRISKILIQDKHDLIHKAVGWMLREIGKRDQKQEELFLKKYYTIMPRTMLRYAIERFSEEKRQRYLKGIIKTSQ